MGIALTVVPFLPAMNIFFRVGFVIAERNLYLPSIGFAMLVAMGMLLLCSHDLVKKVDILLLLI